MALNYSFVVPPTGPAENHIVREMFDDIKVVVDALPTSAANPALSNLAGVAINTTLVSDTNNTDDLGTSSIAWKDLFLTGSTAITISTAGEVTQPLQPSFLVANNGVLTDVTGDNTTYTVVWGTEIIDRGGDFASNTFTAPVSGDYLLSVEIGLASLNTAVMSEINLAIVTSNRSYIKRLADIPAAVTEFAMGYTVVADMDASDTATVTIEVQGSSKVVDISNNRARFSGTLLN